MVTRQILFIVLVFLFCGCGSQKTVVTIEKRSLPLKYHEDVLVVTGQDSLPESAERIGFLRAEASGTPGETGSARLIENMAFEARKAGANVLQIAAEPHLSQNELQGVIAFEGNKAIKVMSGILFRVSDSLEMAGLTERISGTADSVNFVTFCIYRERGKGAMLNYDLYLGDTLLCRVHNNMKQQVTVYRRGIYPLWARTEKRTEIPIQIEPGRTYYIRCHISPARSFPDPR